ncbi:putative branched-subunit amino acid permease [Frigoribacterium sp. UYMn621]
MRPADIVTVMSEVNRDGRTALVSGIVLTAAIVVSAVALAVAIVIAVLVDVQSNYLGIRAEQAGGFDPSVFPPGNVVLWLIGNSFPVLLAILLVLLIAARIIIVGARRDRPRTSDNCLVELSS